MVQNLIVPVDGSPTSWRAADTAVMLARRCDATVRIVEVVFAPRDRSAALARLHDQLGQHDVTGVEVTVEARLTADTVAADIEAMVEQHPEATVVMASHGRGRTAALVGSVADDVLSRTFGPSMIVGPNAEIGDFSGPVVVSVDGSEESEAALPLAAAWAVELGVEPWILNSAEPAGPTGGDVLGGAYVARLAHELQQRSGHRVDFDDLHEGHPATAIPQYADGLGASLIVASSHGRSGWSRLTMGSVTSGFIRHATCPVLVFRLPHPAAAKGEGETRSSAS